MKEQGTFWDFEETGQVRISDPPTSYRAAYSVKAGNARAALLLAHYRQPSGLTDEEACIQARLSLQSEYATRCSELMRAGFLRDTVLTRPGASGMRRMVRCITATGLMVAARL